MAYPARVAAALKKAGHVDVRRRVLTGPPPRPWPERCSSRSPGLRVFGLVVTAADGTVVDLADTAEMRERYATPSGGRLPQARIVTFVVCGTRRVLGAVVDSCALSEQALWDRMVAQLTPGTLNLSHRIFFSMHRWRTAAGTGPT